MGLIVSRVVAGNLDPTRLEVVIKVALWRPRSGLSSLKDSKTMKKNDDGNVMLCFGSRVPKELESKWTPTSGTKPSPVIRFYGSTKEFLNKAWKRPDVELLK